MPLDAAACLESPQSGRFAFDRTPTAADGAGAVSGVADGIADADAAGTRRLRLLRVLVITRRVRETKFKFDRRLACGGGGGHDSRNLQSIDYRFDDR